MSSPTLIGYNDFLRNIVGINTAVLPVNTPVIEWSYNMAINLCSDILTVIPNSPSQFLYTTAVYNLATDTLLTFAQDQPGLEFFQKYQQQYQLRAFVPGVVQTASDESTSTGMLVPDAFKGLTIQNLQNLKTPYGREYLAIAQSIGSLSLLNIQ